MLLCITYTFSVTMVTGICSVLLLLLLHIQLLVLFHSSIQNHEYSTNLIMLKRNTICFEKLLTKKLARALQAWACFIYLQ